MKLEVGKSYRTRNGLRATCVADNLRGEAPCAVIYHDRFEDWVDTATSDGFHRLASLESYWDLISEWPNTPEVNWSVIPPWFNWVAMDYSGDWIAHGEKPEISGQLLHWECASGDSNEMLIPPAFAPKWTGDWKQSLVERPKV